MISWSVLLRLWPVFAVTLVFVLLALMLQASFTEGMRQADERWEKETAKATTVWLRKVRSTELAAREEQRRIAEDYQRELAALNKVQQDEISEILQSSGETLRNTLDDLRTVRSDNGMCKCPGDSGKGMSAGAKAGSGIACYSKDQLLKQVAESVAIGQECDREMIRFRKLIEACK